MHPNASRFLNFQLVQDGILNPTLAAQYLGCSRTWLLQLRERKKVEAVRVNGTYYFGMKSLRILKAEREAARDLGLSDRDYTV